MIEALAALAVVGVLCFGLWLLSRAAKQAGASEQRAEEAEHAVQNAERITAAVADAPRTIGELDDRVQSGERRL